KDSLFDLVAYTDSDYAGASLDRKSTTGGCQFLGCRLISWQCKKQTVVANSTTEAEYVASLSCCGQVLWIQNQQLDYGQSDLVSKRIERNGELKNRKRDEYIKKTDRVFRLELKLMLLGINLLLLLEVNAARYGYIKNHKKTFKNGQIRTRERKSVKEPEAKVKKSTLTQQPRKTKRKDTQVPQPSDPIENVADKAVHKELGNSLVRAATTASSLEAKQDNGNTLQSDEDRLKLNEFMTLCTTLQNKVLDLEQTKTT
ncbi:hypothetical protein Tco_1239921, partial [Tanacetum coccineum]